MFPLPSKKKEEEFLLPLKGKGGFFISSPIKGEVLFVFFPIKEEGTFYPLPLWSEGVIPAFEFVKVLPGFIVFFFLLLFL